MCENKINIRFATDNDTKKVIELWDICFPDESGFNEYFFDKLYKPQYNLLLFKNDVLCSMTQMLPYNMKNGDKIVEVTYIYGACTHPDYRRQHLMDKLLNYSFRLDKKNNKFASVLIPQEEWLFDFYAKFGYKPLLNISQIELDDYVLLDEKVFISDAKTQDIDKMQNLYNTVLNNESHIIRDKNEWQKQIDLFNSCSGKALIIYNDKNDFIGYAFVWKNKDSFYAQELLFKQDCKHKCLYGLQNYFKTKSCKVSGFQFSNMSPLGCILPYNNTAFINGYINLMLN